MYNMKVSVVIPLFNKEKYVRRAIESVLSQRIEDFEIIVINDGSTDNGEEIVRAIKDKRIRLICQENKGVSAARNRGIELARGELVAFLDADDMYEPVFLETILRLRKKFPCAGAYATAYCMVDDIDNKNFPNFEAIPPFPWEGILPNYFRSAIGPSPLLSSAVAVPKYIFDDIGAFPEGEVSWEDLDTWFRIAVKYPIAFSTVPGAKYFWKLGEGIYNVVVSENPVVKTATKAIEKNEIEPWLIPFVRECINKHQICLAAKLIQKKRQAREVRSILMKCNTKRFFVKKTILILFSFLPYGIIRLLYALKGRMKRILKKVKKRMYRAK